jgi:mannose-6-phosphate isomerase-like protein (cupin superfamily)
MIQYDLEKDVIDIHKTEPVEEPGFLRRYIFRGDHMVAYYSQMQPGVDSTTLPEHYRKHPNEEIVFVLQGRLEYEDGRVVEAGQVTINHPMQPHGCKVASQEPAIAFCVHAPPPQRFDQPEMVNHFLGFHRKKHPSIDPES